MPASTLTRYLNPWKYRRIVESERVAELRRRDGDRCARCRRPLRFDLPCGHDQRARIEVLVPGARIDAASLDQLRLCHPRCNASGIDHTEEVSARRRQKAAPELFAKARRKRAA